MSQHDHFGTRRGPAPENKPKIIQVRIDSADANSEVIRVAGIDSDRSLKMQIESIIATLQSSILTAVPAAVTQITADGKAQTAIVEQTIGGYEAYVPNQPGPVATGPSVELAESRLNSTVQFQA
jgi:hypothetical protein